MADSVVGSLTAITTVDDTDELYINDGGVGKKMSMSQLLTYIRGANFSHNAATATQSPAANTDVYVTGSNITVPVSRIKAGTKYKVEMSITKGTAGTGTPVVTVRYGTAAAVGDTSRCAFTWPAANTAAADEMKLTIMCTFYSVGSGTSAVIEGMMLAEHELTTTGFGGTGLNNNIIVNTTGGGFDSTVASSKIGVSINGGTGSAWTIRQVHAVLENLT